MLDIDNGTTELVSIDNNDKCNWIKNTTRFVSWQNAHGEWGYNGTNKSSLQWIYTNEHW